MYASDLHGELWELGYDLFRDRETMKAQFSQVDILDEFPPQRPDGGPIQKMYRSIISFKKTPF
jgi:hypothetical protein